MLADIRPNEERAKAFVVSSLISMGVQAGPLMSEHEVGMPSVFTENSNHCHEDTVLVLRLLGRNIAAYMLSAP